MEKKDEDSPPFWMQSTAALRRADRHRRRQNQASSLFLNTGVLVVFLLAAATVFLAVVIPSVLSLAPSVFNPSLVKSSWNSLNLILVLFAIVCGFLGSKDDDQPPVNNPMKQKVGKSAELLSPRQWNEYQDSRLGYNSFGNADTMMRLRRNSSSHRDLRQEGHWAMNENTSRSYDDSHVYNYQFLRSESRISRSRSLGVIDEDEFDAKTIEVDTFAVGAKEITSPSRTPSPSPPTPKPTAAARKNVHVRSKQFVDEDIPVSNHPKAPKSDSNPPSSHQPAPPAYSKQPLSPTPLSPTTHFWPPPSPPPPPPPPPLPTYSSISATKKHDNKGNNPAKRESKSKVGKQMQRPQSAFESQSSSSPSPLSPTNYFWPSPSPPPPPPPPPQRTLFHRQPMSPPSLISPTNYFWPSPSLPPPRTTFQSQPLSPQSPLSPTNYFWPPLTPPPPPPPPPRPQKKNENKRNIPTKKDSRSKVQIQGSPPPPPPPPPRSRPVVGQCSEDTREKKRGIVIRTLSRLPRRKRKQARRSYENLTEIFQPPLAPKVSIHRSKSTPEFPPLSPPSSPPPPPLPPPPSMFHNMFSKKGKSKMKVHSTSTTAPPPPASPLSKTKTTPSAPKRAVPPGKVNSFSSIDENMGNGSESPLIPIPPPPPPPPPFKMSVWRYVTQGDYVTIESNNNSPRSGYSASSEDEDSWPSNQKTSKVFCPSPDVNIKADDFIARFRAKLTYDKMNSIKRNQGAGPSPLGSDSGLF